jgi:hypothetical protein
LRWVFYFVWGSERTHTPPGRCGRIRTEEPSNPTSRAKTKYPTQVGYFVFVFMG